MTMRDGNSFTSDYDKVVLSCMYGVNNGGTEMEEGYSIKVEDVDKWVRVVHSLLFYPRLSSPHHNMLFLYYKRYIQCSPTKVGKTFFTIALLVDTYYSSRMSTLCVFLKCDCPQVFEHNISYLPALLQPYDEFCVVHLPCAIIQLKKLLQVYSF